MKKSKDNKQLKNWYSDTLSLLPYSPNNVSEFTLKNNKPAILIACSKGNIIFASNNAEICISYLKNNSIKEIIKARKSIELHEDGLIIKSSNTETIYIIYFDDSSLQQAIENANPAIILPMAEYKILKQILCGMTLRQAAKADGVAYETKRSQFKSLTARTGFRNQTTMISETLLILFNSAMNITNIIPNSTRSEANSTRDFLNNYYPNVFRYHQITLNTGRILRIAEAGSKTGKAVLWLHSQTLPSPNQFHEEWLKEHNIRLIIPLREGFLKQSSLSLDKEKHIELCTKDIVDTINLLVGGKVKLIANSTGVPYAIKLAAENSDLISELIICACAYVGIYDHRPVRRLVRGFKHLTRTNETLAKRIFNNYLTKLSNKQGAHAVIKNAYSKSSKDMQIFSNLFKQFNGHSWFYTSYQMSQYSVLMDVSISDKIVWPLVKKIDVDVLFIHGKHDPINSIENAKKAAKQIKNSKFITLEDEGQSLFISRLCQIISLDKKGWGKLGYYVE